MRAIESSGLNFDAMLWCCCEEEVWRLSHLEFVEICGVGGVTLRSRGRYLLFDIEALAFNYFLLQSLKSRI